MLYTSGTSHRCFIVWCGKICFKDKKKKVKCIKFTSIMWSSIVIYVENNRICITTHSNPTLYVIQSLTCIVIGFIIFELRKQVFIFMGKNLLSLHPHFKTACYWRSNVSWCCLDHDVIVLTAKKKENRIRCYPNRKWKGIPKKGVIKGEIKDDVTEV